MAQSPKPGASKPKNEHGLLLDHPQFGKLSGNIAIESATFGMFSRLRGMKVPGEAFADVLFHKPHWLHGLSVHDALAYEHGPKMIHQWIEDLAGRFASTTRDQVISPLAAEDHPVVAAPSSARSSAPEVAAVATTPKRRWFTSPPPLAFRQSPAAASERKAEMPAAEAMTPDQINEAIDDLLPSL